MSYNNLIPTNYKPHKPTTITTSSRTVLGRKELEHKYTRLVRKLNHLQKRYTKLCGHKKQNQVKINICKSRGEETLKEIYDIENKLNVPEENRINYLKKYFCNQP